MLPIRLYGAAVLREPTTAIDAVTAAVRRLTAQMIGAMRAAAGVGLAAPQIGKSLRLVVLHHPELHPKPLTLVNPEILDRSSDLASHDEGCLSLPALLVSVARSRAIRVRYTDLRGHAVEREFQDMLARIVQHECDHLEGKLIVDHMDLDRRLRFESALKKGGHSPRPRGSVHGS